MNWEEPAASVSGLGDRHVDLDYDDLEEAEQDVFEGRQGLSLIHISEPTRQP